MTGQLSICHKTINPGTSPGAATLELREPQRKGSDSSLAHEAQNAPRIGFH